MSRGKLCLTLTCLWLAPAFSAAAGETPDPSTPPENTSSGGSDVPAQEVGPADEAPDTHSMLLELWKASVAAPRDPDAPERPAETPEVGRDQSDPAPGEPPAPAGDNSQPASPPEHAREEPSESDENPGPGSEASEPGQTREPTPEDLDPDSGTADESREPVEKPGPDPNDPLEILRKAQVRALASAQGQGVSRAVAVLDRPVQVADALYVEGEVRAAATLYLLAIRSPRTDIDRGWILLQLGNCYRQTDPPVASEYYRRLMREFASSPWAPVARQQDQLIRWRTVTRPGDLLEQTRSSEAGDPETNRETPTPTREP